MAIGVDRILGGSVPALGAVEVRPAFLVGGKPRDQIAIRLGSLLVQPNQVLAPDETATPFARPSMVAAAGKKDAFSTNVKRIHRDSLRASAPATNVDVGRGRRIGLARRCSGSGRLGCLFGIGAEDCIFRRGKKAAAFNRRRDRFRRALVTCRAACRGGDSDSSL